MWTRLHTLASTATARLADLIFPWNCAGCGSAGSPFCDACAQRVAPMPHIGCPRCGNPLESPRLCAVCASLAHDPLTFARSAALHEEPLRAAIHRLKYEHEPQMAPLLARYLVAEFARTEWAICRTTISAVVPVPLHAQRLAQRGYNQAELLARPFAAQAGLRMAPDLLARQRETRPQVGLNARDRQQNVRASFRALPAIQGQTLLLVDDVFTSGATLRDCARAALESGALEVYALTLARPRLMPRTEEEIHQ